MASLSMEDTEVSEALQKVRQKFLLGLDERILKIENALVDAVETGDSDTALAVIRAETHKIAGISGSLGLPDTGRAARQIEDMIEKGREARQAPPVVLARVAAMLDPFLDHLEEILDEADSGQL